MADTGYPKILGSLEELIAQGMLLDRAKLNPSADLKIAALQDAYTQALALHTSVGNLKSDFCSSTGTASATSAHFIRNLSKLHTSRKVLNTKLSM